MPKNSNVSQGFTRTATVFILGVLLGFTLLLMGLAMLMIGLLASSASNAVLPYYYWYLMGVVSMTIGTFLMHRNLKSVPPLDNYE